jgi:cytochrome c-type biogenesis protein CcmE
MLKRNRRFIFGGIIILAALAYLITGSMREAIVYFKTPSELKADKGASKGKSLRIGGMVLAGSLKMDLKSLTYRFRITDGVESVPVYFRGVPPDLFSEGKGAVIEGRLGEDGVFQATSIMAKHAEEYSPPKNGEYTETQSFIPDQKEKGR